MLPTLAFLKCTDTLPPFSSPPFTLPTNCICSSVCAIRVRGAADSHAHSLQRRKGQQQLPMHKRTSANSGAIFVTSAAWFVRVSVHECVCACPPLSLSLCLSVSLCLPPPLPPLSLCVCTTTDSPPLCHSAPFAPTGWARTSVAIVASNAPGSRGISDDLARSCASCLFGCDLGACCCSVPCVCDCFSPLLTRQAVLLPPSPPPLTCVHLRTN